MQPAGWATESYIYQKHLRVTQSDSYFGMREDHGSAAHAIAENPSRSEHKHKRDTVLSQAHIFRTLLCPAIVYQELFGLDSDSQAAQLVALLLRGWEGETAVVNALAYRPNAGWEVIEGGNTTESTIVYIYE